MTIKQTYLTNDGITGLILAGGRGRRVNGQDKGFLEFEGLSLINRQINWLKPQVNQVLISANRNIEEYKKFKFSVLTDHNENFDGPLFGIIKGLENCNTQWLFILPVDVPHLPSNLIEILLNHINNQINKERASCYYLRTTEQKHYLSMLVNIKNLDNLKCFLSAGNRKVSDFLEEIKAVPIDLGLNERAFKNLNKRDDYL